MLLGKALTVRVRAGTGGGSTPGDEPDSDDSFENEKPPKRVLAYMQVKPQKSTQQLKGRARKRT